MTRTSCGLIMYLYFFGKCHFKCFGLLISYFEVRFGLRRRVAKVMQMPVV